MSTFALWRLFHRPGSRGSAGHTSMLAIIAFAAATTIFLTVLGGVHGFIWRASADHTVACAFDLGACRPDTVAAWKRQISDPTNLAQFSTAYVVLAVFAVLQLRMAHPLVEVRTFAYSGFTLGMVILLMSSGGVLGVNFLLPILLQRGLGHTSMTAALILLPGAVIGAVSAPLIGGALKEHFPPKFIACGFVGVAVMDVAMMLGGSHEGAIAVAYALFMAASGFVLVPDQTHALNQLPSSMNADGSAVMNTMQQLAGAIGTAVASTLISEFSAANVNAGMQQADAYVAGFSTSMWVFFGMAVCGEILALLMFRFSVKRAQE